MNLHHLRVFHAVAQAGGVTAGAGRLNLSQPAASREIRDLEGRLKVTLLDRSSRGVALTEAGRLLLSYADRIFTLEHIAQSELQELAGLAGGHLVIGASNTIGNHLLPPLLGRFNADFPAVEVTMRVSNSEEVAARLLDEVLTIGFVETPVDDSLFDGRPIGRDSIVAVATAGDPLATAARVTAADLADRRVFAREPGSGTRANVDRAYGERGLVFRPALSVGSAEALKNLVLSGGIAWLTRLAVRSELRSGRLVEIPVADLTIERSLSMVWRRGRTLGPAAAAFVRLVEQRLVAAL